MSKRKKIILLFSVALILLIAVLGYLFSPPPEYEPIPSLNSQFGIQDDEFTVWDFINAFVDEKDNAFFDYLIAARRLKKGSYHWEIDHKIKSEFLSFLSIQEYAKEPSPELIKYLEQHQPVIDLIKTATNKNYRAPEFTDFIPLPTQEYLHMVYVMLVQAKIKRMNGRYEEAYKDYLDILKITHNIQKSGSLFSASIGISADKGVFDAMRSGLGNLEIQVLTTVLNGLEEHGTERFHLSELYEIEKKYNVKGFDYMFKNRGNFCFLAYTLEKAPGLYEQYTPKELIDSYADNKDYFKNNLLWIYAVFNQTRIRNNINNFHEKLIQVADEPLQKTAIPLEEEYMKDPVSKIILISSDSANVRQTFADQLARLRGTILRVAVELYQKRYSSLPSGLDDLVEGKILDKVPVDPFGGEQFKYLDNKIYSIGPDFIDDNAAIEFDEHKEDNNKGDLIF